MIFFLIRWGPLFEGEREEFGLIQSPPKNFGMDLSLTPIGEPPFLTKT